MLTKRIVELIALAVLLVSVCLVSLVAAQTRIRDMDLAGVKLGMIKNTAVRAAEGQGFGNTRDSGNIVILKRGAAGSGFERDLIIGLTASGKVHRVRMNIVPRRVEKYEQLVKEYDQLVAASRKFYLDLLMKYGTPNEGGPNTKRAVYQDSDDWGVPTLILDYDTVAGIALERPALLKEDKARNTYTQRC